MPHLPRSLRWQFMAAVAGLALLMLAGGATAVYALRSAANSARQLAEERLVLMNQAQDLVERTFLIERESYQLANADSLDAMRDSYAEIVQQLAAFDLLLNRFAAGDDDFAIVDLHQAGQLFRNTANIAAQLQESALRAAARRAPGRANRTAPTLPANGTSAPPFRDELRRQAGAMVASARRQSDRFTENYREAMQELAQSSARNQRWITALLAASLLLAWLIAHNFLAKHVLARLQLVSRSLRGSDGGDYPALPAGGGDEIDDMAHAVEQFQADRRQLALANQALEAERAQQEELIRKLAAVHSQLLHAEKMASIGQLAAGVAHEINNPIGFVNANLGSLQRYVTDLLKALSAYEKGEAEMTPATRAALADLKRRIDIDYLRGDVADLLAESMDGLQRVKRIVQDLKDFSHVDRTERQWTDLEKNLDSTLNVVWNELKYKADVVKQYGAIPEVECIPSQLSQVFMNLLVNATHAIEGYGRITLRTGCDGADVWLEVEDNGKGISAEHLNRIFDPFFTTKPVGMGTGLGLSLSYGIVKKHGGRIEVKSAVGKGSVFRVVLPLRAAPDAGEDGGNRGDSDADRAGATSASRHQPAGAPAQPAT
jgi:two-component system NtrC family sensor kinase